MFIAAFHTRGSKAAAAVTALLLVLCVPAINGIVQDPITQSSLVLIVAVLIGAALGWIAGDAIVHSGAAGRVVTALGVVVVTVLGLFPPLSSLMKIDNLSDLRLYFLDMFALPLPEGGATTAIRYATIAFVLVTLIALLFSPRVALLENQPRADDAKGTMWNALGSVATALTLLLGLHTFIISQVRWQQEVTIRAIAEENADKPYASRHCLEALFKLDNGQLDRLYVRENVTLQSGQADFIRRCFADHDGPDQEKLYVKAGGAAADPLLTSKGAALLAQRVNYTLTKDGLIASLLRYKIGDKVLVTTELKGRLCGIERDLVQRMSETRLGDPPRLIYDDNDSLYWLVVTSDFCLASASHK